MFTLYQHSDKINNKIIIIQIFIIFFSVKISLSVYTKRVALDQPIIRAPLVICVLESPFLLICVDDSATKHYYNDDNICKIETRIFATAPSLLRNFVIAQYASIYRDIALSSLCYCTSAPSSLHHH